MKPILLVLAIISSIFLCLSVINLIKQSPGSNLYSINLNGNLKGFGSDTEIPGLRELKATYVDKIKTYNATSQKDYAAWRWVSFLVTALTAATTLVSSIKAAKGDGTVSKGSVVLIAVLTFLATLGTWGAGQLTEDRTTAIQKISKLVEHRSNFYIEFQKAETDEQKTTVVEKFSDDLAGL